MKVSDIIREVALRLWTDPSSIPSGAESPHATVSLRVAESLERVAAEVLATMPRHLLRGWRLLPDDALSAGSDGAALLPLPDDFLMLHSICMSHWEREVTEALPPDHRLARLQRSRWHGLRATPARPLAFFSLTPDGRRALRLHPASPGDTLASGWYLPAPKINAAGEIEIPPAAMGRLIDALAALF